MQTKQQPFLLVFVFAVVCVLSAVALVYTNHESRKLFVELEGLTRVDLERENRYLSGVSLKLTLEVAN